MPVPSPDKAADVKAKADAQAMPTGPVLGLSPQRASTSELIVAAPNKPFLWFYRDDEWAVFTEGLDAPTWLPKLRPMPIQGGINQVLEVSDSRSMDVVISKMVGKQQERGWTVIAPQVDVPREFLPEGVQPGPYCRAIACQHPVSGVRGTFHYEPWRTFAPSYDGKASESRFHHAEFNRWLFWLVAVNNATSFTHTHMRPSERALRANRQPAQANLDRVKGLIIDRDLREQLLEPRQMRLKLIADAKVPTFEGATA